MTNATATSPEGKQPAGLGVESLAQRLTRIRDVLLIAAGALYILGYGTWSLFAWHLRIGPVPALDAQYFVAGVPIALIYVVVTAALLVTLRFVLRILPNTFARVPPSAQRGCTILLSLVLLACGAFLLLHSLRREHRSVINTIIFWIGWLVVVIHAAHGLKSTTRLRKVLLTVAIYLSFGWLTFSATGWFVTDGYALIPQALGGGRPRPALLDVRTDAISIQLAQTLGCDLSSGQAVLRTRIVWVLSSGTDQIILSTTAPKQDRHGSVRIGLRASVINAITWLDDAV